MFAEKFDKWVDDYCACFPFSGSVCITKDDQVIYRRNCGLANREWNIPIDDNTHFRLYSLTKPFTAIGLLKLYEQGKVSLDEHPGKYLPEARYLHPDITVRMLLNHSHGLPDFGRSPENASLSIKYPVDDWQMMESVRNMPMDFAPGTACNYTNIGFYLVSMIIEAVSGMPFRDYMEQEVFVPLGMVNTLIDSAYRLIPNRASGYDIDGEEIVAAPNLCIDALKGAGNAVGTVNDVYRLHLAAKNKTLLKPETWDMIFTPGKGNFGLGCIVFKWHGKMRYQHNGGHSGFRTLHIQLPEDDFGLILLSNMGFGNARNAFPEAAYHLFYEAEDTYNQTIEMDKGFVIGSSAASPVLTPKRPAYYSCDLSVYVGKYSNGINSATISLHEKNGVLGLQIFWKNGRRLEAYPYAQDRFFNRVIDEAYDFVKADGDKYIFCGLPKCEE